VLVFAMGASGGFDDFCCESYMGAFTKVARVDQAKAAAHGTGAPYGRAVPVPELVEAHVDLLRGLFYLVILATRKSSLIAQILPWKCP